MSESQQTPEPPSQGVEWNDQGYTQMPQTGFLQGSFDPMQSVGLQGQHLPNVQMYQQSFIFGMPATAAPGMSRFMTIPAQQNNQNASGTINPIFSGLVGEGGFGGFQAIPSGFDPIFQVLQASFNQTGRGNHHAASQSGLESVVHLRICQHEKLECPISSETLECGEWASRMPCGHYFSKESLESWLAHHNSCPVCRYELHTGECFGMHAVVCSACDVSITVDEDYNRSRQLRPEAAVAAAAAASLSAEDLVRTRVDRARTQALDALTEAALADAGLPAAPPSPRAALSPPPTEEGLVTEEWRDALCDLLLLAVAA